MDLLIIGVLAITAAVATAATTIQSMQQQQQVAYAFPRGSCSQCAKGFAPGQEKITIDDDDLLL